MEFVTSREYAVVAGAAPLLKRLRFASSRAMLETPDDGAANAWSIVATFELHMGKQEATEAAVRLLRQAGTMRLYSRPCGGSEWRGVGDLVDDVELAARTLIMLSEGSAA